MTTPELLQRLPRLREFFPQELVLEWPVPEVLRAEKQQRAATLAALDRWRQSTVLDKNAMVFNEKIN
jgi:hypothetical protein